MSQHKDLHGHVPTLEKDDTNRSPVLKRTSFLITEKISQYHKVLNQHKKEAAFSTRKSHDFSTSFQVSFSAFYFKTFTKRSVICFGRVIAPPTTAL